MSREKGKSQMKSNGNISSPFCVCFKNTYRGTDKRPQLLHSWGENYPPILGRFFLIIGIGGGAMSPLR